MFAVTNNIRKFPFILESVNCKKFPDKNSKFQEPGTRTDGETSDKGKFQIVIGKRIQLKVSTKKPKDLNEN